MFGAGFLEEFKKFALRGNVIDLAVGFTVGAAFTTIVQSLVDDVIMPPIGLLIGDVDFSDLAITLREATEAEPAVLLRYGNFLNNLVTFLIIALAMFVIIRLINHLDERLERQFGRAPKPADEPANKKCPYCLSTIPYQAVRCPSCTSHLDEPAAQAGK